MARALDSFGFADLELCIAFHVALTAKLRNNDPNKFQLGTPASVWRAMERCWEVEPTSMRIVQDISDFQRILEKIVEARGCVVHGEAFRSGHRSIRSDGDGLCSSIVKSYQRKETLSGRPVHNDAMSEFNRLVAGVGADLHDIGEQLNEVEDTIDEDNLLHANDTIRENDDEF